MKTILGHLSYANKNYLGTLKHLTQYQDKVRTIFTPLHGQIFDASEETKADYILLSFDEYTQEFHDFLSQTNKNVLLFIDAVPEGNAEEVLQFFKNKTNIKYIASSNSPDDINTFVKYDKLYDSSIFYKTNSSRKDKIALILSRDNDKNETIKDILYPNPTPMPVVCFNNPNFNHITNLGILTDTDLAEIFNTYHAVIDLDEQFMLEALACGCYYYDMDNFNKNIYNASFKDGTEINLSEHTFVYFIENKLLPLFGE